MTSHEQPAEAQVEQTAKAWMEAAGRRDRAALEQFLADEFTMVTNRGSLIDKGQWLENMLHRVGREFTAPEFLDVRVRVYGDAALMTSRNVLRATCDGTDWSGELYLTDVWVRRDGRWQLVRRHASNLVPGAPRDASSMSEPLPSGTLEEADAQQRAGEMEQAAQEIGAW